MRYEDEVEGNVKQVVGTVKEELGKLVSDHGLEERGSQERFDGEVQEKVGKARRQIGEAVEDLGTRIANKR